MSFAKKLARKREKKVDGKITKQVKSIDRDVRRAYIRQNVTDAVIRMQAVQNVMTMLLVAAHETFGFGDKRLTRIYNRMKSQVDCIHAGYVTVDEICQILRDEAKMKICDSRNPKVSRQRLIEYRVIDELSAAFLISLMDEFGFKAKRLHRVYAVAALFSKKLDLHEMEMGDLEEILATKAKFVHKGGRKGQ
jgi:hypothetical protein